MTKRARQLASVMFTDTSIFSYLSDGAAADEERFEITSIKAIRPLSWIQLPRFNNEILRGPKPRSTPTIRGGTVSRCTSYPQQGFVPTSRA